MGVDSFTKKHVEDLACFGGACLFSAPKPTSSLYQPSFGRFLSYSEQFFERHHFTNNGVLVQQLERRLADFHGVRHCVAFCSGFWALALTIASLALKAKSEIIMPSLTYRRMADIAAWVNLKPHFCEVDPEKSLAPSAQTVAERITDETALILAVHPIVNCCDVEEIVALGEERGIPVLFDSVESVFEKIPAGKIGSFGDAECFSMHASKLINAFEGGYVTTNREDLARRLTLIRTFGFEGQDNCVLPGGSNAKLNEIHAAMALASLDELERLVDNNRQRYRSYNAGLVGLKGIRLLQFDESTKTSYKNIVVEINESWPLTRDETVYVLNRENVLARSYYSPPLHRRKMNYAHVPAKLEVTDGLSERFMLLPCGDLVSTRDIEEILAILQFISSHGGEIAKRLRERARSGE